MFINRIERIRSDAMIELGLKLMAIGIVITSIVTVLGIALLIVMVFKR